MLAQRHRNLAIKLGLEQIEDVNALDDKQKALLEKWIKFECMSMQEGGEHLRRELYEWFFKWDGELKKDELTKQYKWDKSNWKGDDSDDDKQEEEEKTEEEKKEEESPEVKQRKFLGEFLSLLNMFMIGLTTS